MATQAPIVLSPSHPITQATATLLNTMHGYGEAIGRASRKVLVEDQPLPAQMDNAPVFFDAAKSSNPIAAPAGYGLCNVGISAAENRIEGTSGNAHFWRVMVTSGIQLRFQDAALQAMRAVLDALEAEGLPAGETLYGLQEFLERCSFVQGTTTQRTLNTAILGIFALDAVVHHVADNNTCIIDTRTALAVLDGCALARAYGMTTVHLHAMGPKPLPSVIPAGARNALLAYAAQCSTST